MKDDNQHPSPMTPEMEELHRKIEALRFENLMCERYIEEKCNQEHGVNQTRNERNDDEQDDNDDDDDDDATESDPLSIAQKVQIAKFALKHLNKEHTETKTQNEQSIKQLSVSLEETDLRIADLQKKAFDFKKKIVLGAECERTGRTLAEKVVHYMENKAREQDTIIEKLRLKNNTLKNQKKKLEIQLRQKEEAGGSLHYIDFHQLQIENKHLTSKVESTNKDVIQQKSITGKTLKELNALKHQLSSRQSEHHSNAQDILAKQQQLDRLEEEIVKVKKSIAAEKRYQKKGEETRVNHDGEMEEDMEMPQMQDYIQERAMLYELRDEIKNWERKVEIAQLGSKKKKKKAVC